MKPVEKPQLIPVNQTELFQYLSSQTGPVMEITLLKRFTAYSSMEDDLFVHHFSLAHALYRLKNEHAQDGWLLYPNSMRIRLIKLPPEGRCFHYDPHEGSFCSKELTQELEDGRFCSAHKEESLEASLPVLDVLTGFYLDRDNISFGSSEKLEKLLSGFYHFVFNRRSIEKAHDIMGLKKVSLQNLREQYTTLARIHHPDMGGSEEMMKDITWAYTLLKEVYGL